LWSIDRSGRHDNLHRIQVDMGATIAAHFLLNVEALWFIEQSFAAR